MTTISETKRWLFFCKLLPKKLIYYCALQLISEATTGKYSNTIVPELTAMNALRRYGCEHQI